MGLRDFIKKVADKIRRKESEVHFRVDLSHPPEVLIIPESTDPQALANFIFTGGPMPPGARVETYEQYSSFGRLPDCDCQLIRCVCAQARRHQLTCKYRKAMTCAIGISCEEHGLEICPTCDPCSCGVPLEENSESEVGGMVRGT
jgi:hypothetical protein